MRILIVYGTTEGQTRKIAAFLAHRFTDEAHEVRLADAADLPPALDPAAYDAILVAARVHAGKYPRTILRFVRRNRAILASRPSGFVSVSLFAAIDTDKSRARIGRYVERFARKSGWKPARVHQAAGGRPYTRYGAFGRWLLGRIDGKAWGRRVDTSFDHEYTDWGELGRFGDAFLAAAQPAVEIGAAA